jgi:hypothetical protein
MDEESHVNILCDVCFYERDIHLLMNGPIEVLASAPWMKSSMVVYECNCGRLYSSSLGYFTLIQGEGLRDVRKLAPCNSPKGEPMYLAEVFEDGRLKLKCTTCDYERIVART